MFGDRKGYCMDLEPGNTPTRNASESRDSRGPDQPRNGGENKSTASDHGAADTAAGKGAAGALAQMLELEKMLQRDRFTRLALDEPERPNS